MWDALNRLQSATEMFGSSQSWKQTFMFDRFGNRIFNTSGSNTTTLPSSFNADIYNPTIDKANNRYLTGQGYSYDLAGNVTANAAGQSFVYDAEQHQTEVKVISTSATVATYKYDGSGQRVKKIVGTEETTFIYDAMGKSVAEYVLNSTTTPDVHTRYVTQDQLGSPRVITDGIGQVQERHDYLAYGEEASSGLSTVRTSAQKYAGTSAVRKRYTGYERDDESGLDYAQARYYNNAHGRFTSVDPLTASVTIKNPQTFNRYSYALNSPYKFTDPLGLKAQYTGVNDPYVPEMNGDPPPPAQQQPPPQQGPNSQGEQKPQAPNGTLNLDGHFVPCTPGTPAITVNGNGLKTTPDGSAAITLDGPSAKIFSLIASGNDGPNIVIKPDTTLTVSPVAEGGYQVSASPAVEINTTGPNVKINSVQFGKTGLVTDVNASYLGLSGPPSAAVKNQVNKGLINTFGKSNDAGAIPVFPSSQNTIQAAVRALSHPTTCIDVKVTFTPPAKKP